MVKDKTVNPIYELGGIGKATGDKLIEGGFVNLMSIASAKSSVLKERVGLGEALARKIINEAHNKLDVGFKSGNEAKKDRMERVNKITTGCSDFDELLGGGFETCGVIECYGQFGSGKTALAHALAVNVIEKDPEAVVFWIDTETTFRHERIEEICKARKLDGEKVLENIKIAKAFNSDHQVIIANKISDMLNKEEYKTKLIIVDSLTAHFRAEFIGRGELAVRQQALNVHMHTLMRIADMHSVCVYVTNQVMAKPDSFFGDPTAPIGGHIVGHNSQTRLYLRRGAKGSRVAKLVDAPHLPDGECQFAITDKGIEDFK